MRKLKTFEEHSSSDDLDKQDQERAYRNMVSNFPHIAKSDAEKREFEEHSSSDDLDKQDQERAYRNMVSNFPHIAKSDAEKREKKSRKKNSGGTSDSSEYDSSSRSGWQDGMGVPPWYDRD